MNRIKFNLYPGNKKRAVTFSYDDGRIYDEKMTKIFDRYGAKCTYNLNSNNLVREGYIDKAFVRELSSRHEIACHSYTHPHLNRIPPDKLILEIYEDRKALEDITGKPVFGMAYPFGSTADENVSAALKACGIKYCRTTAATHAFGIPDNWRQWHPTCHHDNAVDDARRFVNDRWALPLLYVWGHSYNFNDDSSWAILDELFEILSAADVWYATNGEIYDYLNAIKGLRITLNESCVYNPSATTVYATVDNKPMAFEACKTTVLD